MVLATKLHGRKSLGLVTSESDFELSELTPKMQATYHEFKDVVEREAWTCKELAKDGSTFQLDQKMLLRFLVARKFNLVKAKKMLREHLDFRDKWTPGLITPDDIPNCYPSGIYRMLGPGLDGINVMFSSMENFDPNDYDVEEYTKYLLFTFESSIRCMDSSSPAQHIWIFDLAGFKSSHAGKASMALIKILTAISQDHYPERLMKAVVLNAPMIFSMVWSALKPFVDPKTRKKVEFAKQKAVVKYVDAALVPPKYGGTKTGEMQMYPVDEIARHQNMMGKSPLSLDTTSNSKRTSSTFSSPIQACVVDAPAITEQVVAVVAEQVVDIENAGVTEENQPSKSVSSRFSKRDSKQRRSVKRFSNERPESASDDATASFYDISTWTKWLEDTFPAFADKVALLLKR